MPDGGFEIPEAFSQAKEAAERTLLDRTGVIGVEIGLRERGGEVTDELALRVVVAEKKDVPEAEALPEEFAGVPVDVVERGEAELWLDLKRYDPLVGGCSGSRCKFGNGGSGTLGGVVNISGQLGVMSNAHVLGTVSGDKGCSQPEIFTGSCPKDQVGEIVASQWDDRVDVAVALFNGKRGIKSEIAGIGAVNGSAAALPGMEVRKRGKTTGLTSGVVVTPSGPVPDASETPKGQMIEQIVVRGDGGKPFGDEGDSGSFLVDKSGNVVGLLWGGTVNRIYGFACPIDRACKAVGASVATGVSKAGGGGGGGGGGAPGKLQSQLFSGDELLQRIADDVGRVRISRTQNSTGPSVARVQQALLIWDADALPNHGADGKYGDETASTVRRFKVQELGVPEAEVISDVGPKTVVRLDEIALASEG